MARNRKGKKVVNWDTIDDNDLDKVSSINPGDLVRPTAILSISDNAYDGVHVATKHVIPRSQRKERKDEEPNLCGFTHGIYLGQRRLNLPRKFSTGSFWTSNRKIEKFQQIFDVYQFGNYTVVVDEKYIAPVQ
jgi:hypothetical protein